MMERLIDAFLSWPIPAQVGFTVGGVLAALIGWCAAWNSLALIVRGHAPVPPPKPPSPARHRDADVLEEFHRGLKSVLEQSQPVIGPDANSIIEAYTRACGTHLGVKCGEGK